LIEINRSGAIPDEEGGDLAVLADVVLLAVGGSEGDALVDGILEVALTVDEVGEGRGSRIYKMNKKEEVPGSAVSGWSFFLRSFHMRLLCIHVIFPLSSYILHGHMSKPPRK
jgi:hypothetical protein